jgi:hypothetical protein
MRKHIGKALQVRSVAIRTALERYNAAAQALVPPRRPLHWDEVVEYGFLADFDLLHAGREDITDCPWAKPAGRLAMDYYFKISRAREEIDRLNIEIRRLSTYLRDEASYLKQCESRVKAVSPELAHQMALRRLARSRFDAHHLQVLNSISQLPGFTGTLTPGESLDKEAGASANTPSPHIPCTFTDDMFVHIQLAAEEDGDTAEILDAEQGHEDDQEELSQFIHDVAHMSGDA